MKKFLTNTHSLAKSNLYKNIDPIGKAFGLVVIAVRKSKGMSQEALANQADIERAHMGCIERGEKVPSITLLLKIAKALGLSSAVLMEKTEEVVEQVAVEIAKNKPIPVDVQIERYFKKMADNEIKK